MPINQSDSFGRRFIKEMVNPVDKPAIHTPLANLVEKLTTASNLSSKPDVLISPEINYNASAMNKKYMMVNLGLLKHAKSPDEVAFVMAHELSHAQHGDSKTKMLFALGVFSITIGSIILSSKLIKNHGQKKHKPMSVDLRRVLSLMTGLVVFALLNRFHRKIQGLHEQRCDREAVKMLHQAGFSIKGFKSAFEQPREKIIQGMHFKKLATSARKRILYGRIHPKDDARIKAIENYISQHPAFENAKLTPVMSPMQWRSFQKEASQLFDIRKAELKQEALEAYNLHL